MKTKLILVQGMELTIELENTEQGNILVSCVFGKGYVRKESLKQMCKEISEYLA